MKFSVFSMLSRALADSFRKFVALCLNKFVALFLNKKESSKEAIELKNTLPVFGCYLPVPSREPLKDLLLNKKEKLNKILEDIKKEVSSSEGGSLYEKKDPLERTLFLSEIIRNLYAVKQELDSVFKESRPFSLQLRSIDNVVVDINEITAEIRDLTLSRKDILKNETLVTSIVRACKKITEVLSPNEGCGMTYDR